MNNEQPKAAHSTPSQDRLTGVALGFGIAMPILYSEVSSSLRSCIPATTSSPVRQSTWVRFGTVSFGVQYRGDLNRFSHAPCLVGLSSWPQGLRDTPHAHVDYGSRDCGVGSDARLGRRVPHAEPEARPEPISDCCRGPSHPHWCFSVEGGPRPRETLLRRHGSRPCRVDGRFGPTGPAGVPMDFSSDCSR